MPRDDHAERQQARRDRLRKRAADATAEAERRFARAQTLAGAMNGQPILVGHHSEKRHRRDIDRMDRDMQKGSEKTAEAKELKRRAAAVGSAGISSDDPTALDQLRAKLERLEEARAQYKAINAHYKKHQNLDTFPGISDESKARLCAHVGTYSWITLPVERYMMSNLSARIRSTKARIAELETEDKRTPDEDLTGDGWRIYEDTAENRVCFEITDERNRPGTQYRREVGKLMKRHGFNWSRRQERYQRRLNIAGRIACQHALGSLVRAGLLPGTVDGEGGPASGA